MEKLKDSNANISDLKKKQESFISHLLKFKKVNSFKWIR